MKIKIVVCLLAFAFFNCNKTKEIIDAIDPNSLHNRSVGASANELLSASRYTSLKVEIQYMTGYAPDANAVNHLQNFLATYLNKPAGINIVTKEIGVSSSATLSADDVHAIEKANRTAFTTENQLAVYILYTNGAYTDNSVLGLAYRNTSAAIFGKRVKENSGGIGQVSRTKLEATVLEHEVGHLLGLVDIGSPMQIAHKANGNHCSNQNCLMYYASETTDILGFLLTGNVPSPDANCVADLKANGGK